MWDYAGPLTAADEGKVVKVRGTVGEFRGTPQFTASRIRLAAADDQVDPASLVPTAPIDREAAMAALQKWAASIEDEDYRAVAEAMLEPSRSGAGAHPGGQERPPRIFGRTADAHRQHDEAGGLFGGAVPGHHRPQFAAGGHTAPRHGQGAGSLCSPSWGWPRTTR